MPDHPSKKRRSRRDNVLLSASLELADGSQSVKLRNLSEEGALVEGAVRLECGCELVFRRNEIAVTASVVWVRDGFAGIAFKRPLDRKAVLRQMPVSVPRPEQQSQHHKRPGFTNHRISSAERAWIVDWGNKPRG